MITDNQLWLEITTWQNTPSEVKWKQTWHVGFSSGLWLERSQMLNKLHKYSVAVNAVLLCSKGRRVVGQCTCCAAKRPFPVWTHQTVPWFCRADVRKLPSGARTSSDPPAFKGPFGTSALQHWKPQAFESMNQAFWNGDGFKNDDLLFLHLPSDFFLLLGLMSSICSLKPWRLEIFSWWNLTVLCNHMTPGTNIVRKRNLEQNPESSLRWHWDTTFESRYVALSFCCFKVWAKHVNAHQSETTTSRTCCWELN